jgi:hypothetical protein
MRQVSLITGPYVAGYLRDSGTSTLMVRNFQCEFVLTDPDAAAKRLLEFLQASGWM